MQTLLFAICNKSHRVTIISGVAAIGRKGTVTSLETYIIRHCTIPTCRGPISTHYVNVKNGNVDASLKKFKQRVAKSGLPSEVKKKQQYDKPGIQRRNAKKEAIKNSNYVMNGIQKRIIELITNNNRITQNEIANIIGVNVRTIKRNFKVLIDNSIVKRIGSDKTGYWQVLK